MAGADGSATDTMTLFRALEAAPHGFDFFQALRRLECAHLEKPKLGDSLTPRDDPIRLGQEPSLTFAPATLAKFAQGTDGRPPHLDVFFLGLFGPNGPLPLHLTEYARERARHHGDHTFARFLDVFHHRILSLFYRAWADARPTVSFDRLDDDRFGYHVGAVFGLGSPGLRNRDAMPDLAKLHFAGRFVGPNRPPEGLQAIIESFFRLPASIREFIGHWLELTERNLCRLGGSEVTGCLGRNAVIGASVWDRQHKFRIVLGPLTLRDYRRLLPGGDSLERLVAVVRNYVGEEYAWDVKLVLEKDEVPTLRLGESGELGWTTWIGERARNKHADDLRLDPFSRAA